MMIHSDVFADQSKWETVGKEVSVPYLHDMSKFLNVFVTQFLNLRLQAMLLASQDSEEEEHGGGQLAGLPALLGATVTLPNTCLFHLGRGFSVSRTHLTTPTKLCVQVFD